MVSKKDEFVSAFEQKFGAVAVGAMGAKAGSMKEFADLLNEHPDLRRLFREAVEESKGTPEEEAAAGLDSLFAGL